MNISVNSVEQMHQLGTKIGAQLKPSDVVVLSGELGSGKTVLTQGIAVALGVLDVTSPTFVISRIHKGNPNFIHIDAYRLLDSDISNFTDLDFESYLPSSIFVIEWGAPYVTTLTDQYLDIKITEGDTEDSRNLSITTVGKRWDGLKL
jgi:tRNA threonylcarbamoyladenosine biosynthesis protein TsaE